MLERAVIGERAGQQLELQTNRFVLRDFGDADIEAFDAYHRDPRFQAFYGSDEARPGHARELVGLSTAWSRAEPRLNYQLAIINRRKPEILPGCCGLRREGAEPRTAELGIELAPEFGGRFGYAIELLRALAKFGFTALELEAIYGLTVSANFRIARLLEAIGATSTTRPTSEWMAGKGWTQLEWRLTRTQWQGERKIGRLR